jgi:hypothetical protein
LLFAAPEPIISIFKQLIIKRIEGVCYPLATQRFFKVLIFNIQEKNFLNFTTPALPFYYPFTTQTLPPDYPSTVSGLLLRYPCTTLSLPPGVAKW